MITFRHHSRFLSFRRPQGAVPCNTSVTIEAEIGGDSSAHVQLRLYNQLGVESFFDLTRTGDRAHGEIPMPEVPCLVWPDRWLESRELSGSERSTLTEGEGDTSGG